MKVIKVLATGFGCNSYIVTADGKDAVVVDCAEERLFDICKEKGLKPCAVLLTHGHFDHVGGCGKFFKEGVPVYCGEYEESLIFSKENRGLLGGVYIPDFKIHKTLRDGESITLAGITFKVLHTPGHTAGGVCYIAGDNIFSGDTLFRRGIGRTDLPTGDFLTLIQSIKKLFALDGNYKVYCGHEEDTELDFERKNNPYVEY